MGDDLQTNGFGKLAAGSAIAVIVLSVLFVMIVGIAYVEGLAQSYKASIVHDTVEALKHGK